MRGGQGDDIFIYAEGDGSDTIYGGGGNWVDAISLEGFAADSAGSDWTIELDVGTIDSQDDGEMILSDGASGTIEFEDGSTIDFFNVEEIRW